MENTQIPCSCFIFALFSLYFPFFFAFFLGKKRKQWRIHKSPVVALFSHYFPFFFAFFLGKKRKQWRIHKSCVVPSFMHFFPGEKAKTMGTCTFGFPSKMQKQWVHVNQTRRRPGHKKENKWIGNGLENGPENGTKSELQQPKQKKKGIWVAGQSFPHEPARYPRRSFGGGKCILLWNPTAKLNH